MATRPDIPFPRLLAAATERVGSLTCVGLDPVFEKLPAALRAEHWEPARALDAFCHAVIDAVAPFAAAVKPQSACFERYGHAGFAALERVCIHARTRGLVVILDAKRGDIGVSAEHYAAAATHLQVHAITVNPYLGSETLRPYLDAGLGVFGLVRTSNPGSDEIQSPRLSDGRSVAALVADSLASLAGEYPVEGELSPVGAVVGLTKAADGAGLRARLPDAPFLVPGFGAQGGGVDDLDPLLRPSGHPGVIVNASRSVTYPATPADAPLNVWAEAVAQAARGFHAALATRARVSR